MSKIVSVVSCLGLCAALAGCGSKYSGEKRYPLAGEASLDGQPIDLGSISFTSEGGSGRPSGGVITDGKYVVPAEKGATAGTYRVEIHWLKRTGKKLRDPDTGEMFDERREAIPDKLYANSELTVEVPLPANRHDFQLKSK